MLKIFFSKTRIRYINLINHKTSINIFNQKKELSDLLHLSSINYFMFCLTEIKKNIYNTLILNNIVQSKTKVLLGCNYPD